MSQSAQPCPLSGVPVKRGPAGVAGEGPDHAPSGARAVGFPVHGGLAPRLGRHEPEIPVQDGMSRDLYPDNDL
jgi:hypothetical protein